MRGNTTRSRRPGGVAPQGMGHSARTPHPRTSAAGARSFSCPPSLERRLSVRPSPTLPKGSLRGLLSGLRPSVPPGSSRNAQTENAQAEPPVLSRDVRRKAVFSQARRRRRRGHPRQGPPPPHHTRRAKNPILWPILGGTIHRLPRRARNQPHSGWFPVSPHRSFKWLKPEKGHDGVTDNLCPAAPRCALSIIIYRKTNARIGIFQSLEIPGAGRKRPGESASPFIH